MTGSRNTPFNFAGLFNLMTIFNILSFEKVFNRVVILGLLYLYITLPVSKFPSFETFFAYNRY